MNNMLEQLDTIKKVGIRLRDLAQSRAVPPNISHSLKNDSDSIRWAHSMLRDLYVTDAVVLVSKHDIRDLFRIIKSDSFEFVNGHHVAIMFKPDTIQLEMLREKFNFDNKEMTNESLNWMVCHKYYMQTIQNGITDGLSALFECSLSKRWLDEIGLREARSEIYNWASKAFNLLESKGEE